jgi:hypothetical protein
VDQLDIPGQNVLQAESINGVGMATAYFHHAVVALGAGKAPNLISRAGNQFWLSELVNVSHTDRSLAGRA